MDAIKYFRRFLALMFLPVAVTAQETNITGQLDSKLPVDPKVRIGQLDNGMRYYIRQNKKPENRVEMRLVVNAGSMQEDEDQLGLAHFVEHMAFNGTKNFEKNEIVDYLQSIGVQFGADLNAYTSFNETVYILPIPSDDEEILNKGLQVLEDWAHNVTFSEEEIDKERGVVLEEWRLGRGANQRMRDQYFPVLFKDSRYADRLPIGKKEIIENHDYEAARRFYRDWYRPDLMAVVAVGDVDVDQMEAKIKQHFNNVKPTKKPRPRTSYEVPNHNETYITIASDKEAAFTQIQLFYKADSETTETLKDYRRDLIYQIYNGMLNRRLNELRQSAEPPFIFGSTSFGGLVRDKSSYSSFAVVGQDGIEKGLQALLTENERVKRFGFTAGELDRYKKEMLNALEKAFKESDKTESGVYASEYVGNYLDAEPIPGIEFEYKYSQQVLPTIEIEEVNALASKWITETNRVVVVTGPEKEGVVLPAEEEIRKMLADAEKIEVTAYEDELSGSELMETKPTAGKVANSTTNEDLGVTELALSNGMVVVLKPTDFKNDEILMSAYSLGGHSLYGEDVAKSAENASGIINQSGVRDFSPTDLQKLFAGKTVRVSPFIGTYREGFSGSAAPKDFETMLQLVNLYFTAPRKDPEAFQSFKSRNKMLFQNLMSNPQFYFQDQVSKIMTQNHPRGGGFPTAVELEQIDFGKSYEVYRERFANAGDFKFFFVGNFNIAEITPLLETYLGSLPNINREETWKDLGIRPPKGVVKETLNRGTDPKSFVTIRFTGDHEYGKKANHAIRSLGEVLTIKLIEILREEKSGVYGVGASGSASQFPYQRYSMNISFPCAPENAEDLIAATFTEIERIKTEGVSEEDLQKVKEAQTRNREENLKRNRYWLNQLNAYYYNGSDLSTFNEAESLTDALTIGDIQEAAKKYFDLDNYVQIVLMPEEGE